MSSAGFQIVGNQFDSCDDDDETEEAYETIYALIQQRSPKYRESFGNSLINALNKLA